MATYKIKGKRYLRKYTAPVLTPVYGVSGDVATMAANLCSCPWEPVKPSDACFPSHIEASLDGNVAARDHFDAAAFCAGHADGLHRVYGQAACYVFTLPDEAEGASLTSLSVPVYSDPYNAGGVRLAVHTSDTLEIPADCATARTGSAHVDGVAPRTSSTSEDGAQTWTGAHATATITPASAITLKKYLMVVVALESFVGRAGYAEGSAYAMNAFSITTSTAISADGWTDGNAVPINCTGEAEPVSSQRLIITSYPNQNVSAPGPATKPGGLRAHRIFGSSKYGWVAAVGGATNMCAPALTILHGSYVYYLGLGEDYLGTNQALGTKDADADWYDTPPGKALQRGVGVTGVYLAPQYGATNLSPPSEQNAFKYFFVYVSTKEGMWRAGTASIAYGNRTGSYVEFFPLVSQIGSGGDLLLVTKSDSTAHPFDKTVIHEHYAECVSVGDGIITVGTRSVPFSGRVTGLGHCDGADSGTFLVAGDFDEIGGVRCRHVAKIDSRQNELAIKPLGIDGLLVPNCLDGFRVIRAGGAYYALGDFTELGGVSCPYGAATVTSTTVTPLGESIVDVAEYGVFSISKLTADRVSVAMS